MRIRIFLHFLTRAGRRKNERIGGKMEREKKSTKSQNSVIDDFLISDFFYFFSHSAIHLSHNSDSDTDFYLPINRNQLSLHYQKLMK